MLMSSVELNVPSRSNFDMLHSSHKDYALALIMSVEGNFQLRHIGREEHLPFPPMFRLHEEDMVADEVNQHILQSAVHDRDI